MASVASLEKIEIIRSQEFMPSEARLKFLKKIIILGPKTAILGPHFCRILVLGPHFWWSGGGSGPRGPPWIRPWHVLDFSFRLIRHHNTLLTFIVHFIVHSSNQFLLSENLLRKLKFIRNKPCHHIYMNWTNLSHFRFRSELTYWFFIIRIVFSYKNIPRDLWCQHKARPFLFVGLRYPPIWKNGISKKKKTKTKQNKKKKDFARHHGKIVHFWPHQKSPRK